MDKSVKAGDKIKFNFKRFNLNKKECDAPFKKNYTYSDIGTFTVKRVIEYDDCVCVEIEEDGGQTLHNVDFFDILKKGEQNG